MMYNRDSSHSSGYGRKLTSQEAVERMRLKDLRGAYFLNAGFEKRMSTIAQQYRAISLIGTLLDQGDNGFKIDPAKPIAIIGAGAAGVTAALLAVWRGCKQVYLFERNDRPFIAYECSGRLIHPRLFEWPDQAQLALLDWDTGFGKAVTDQLRKQWKIWLGLYGSEQSADRRLYWHPSSLFKGQIPSQDLEGHFSFTVEHNSTELEFTEFQAMIFGTGFGKSKRPSWAKSEECYVYDYWADNPLARADVTKDIAVFGNGDSALADAIELAVKIKGDRSEYRPLDQFELAKLMATIDTEDLRDRVTEIERCLDNAYESASSESNSDKRQQLEHQADIAANDALKTISSDEITKNFLDRLQQFHNVTLVVKDDRELTSGAFLLNRFIAGQLIKQGLIKVLHCGSANSISMGKKYTFEAGGATKDFDAVLVRTGQEVPKEIEPLQQKFRCGLEKQGYKSRSRGINLSIARQPPSTLPADKEWVLFSDLYDSTTQAEVFDILKLKEDYTREDAETELLTLCARRLMFDIVRRQKIIIVDTQLLDGVFFLRWIPQLAKDPETNAEILKLLKEHVIFRYRGDSIEQCLESYFFQKGNRLKQFEFSAISDKNIRKEIAGWFEKQSKGDTSYPTIEDIAKDSEFDARWKEEWQGLRDRQNALLQALKQLRGSKLLTFESRKAPWDQFSAVEDPALFSASIGDADAELLRGMYHKKADTGQTPTRSDFYRYVEEDRFHNREQNGKDYFDRSYNRTMARQHGATIFETVRVSESANSTIDSGEKSDKSLWKFNRRDGKERVLKVIEIEISDLTPDKLQHILEKNMSARNTQNLFKLKNNGASTDNNFSTLGERALALLRGRGIDSRRLWVEEASEVGAKLPAVIDEDFLQNNRSILLSRTEYEYDI